MATTKYYSVRLNPRAFNPLTKRVNPERLWEVEQCSDKDSEKVIWHCAEVRINGTLIRELYELPKEGQPPWEMKVSGIVVRGYDDAIEIRGGAHEVG